MEKKNNNGVLIGVLIGIIIMLLVFVCLFATNTISFNTKEVSNNNQEEKNENSIKKDTNTSNQANIELNKENNNKLNKELSKEEATSILKERTRKVFKYVHSLSAYCGETEVTYPEDINNYDKEKFIVEGYITYFVSKYKNKEELNNYMKTFMNDEVIKKYSKEGVYTVETYKEQNGHLYCLNSNKDCGMSYNESKSSYTITNLNNDIISAIGKIAYNSCGETEEYLTVLVEIAKDNNNWLITKYEEQ